MKRRFYVFIFIAVSAKWRYVYGKSIYKEAKSRLVIINNMYIIFPEMILPQAGMRRLADAGICGKKDCFIVVGDCGSVENKPLMFN